MDRIVIVGGGAAGMFASILLGEAGQRVTVLERNEKTGKKLYITGKGRCNFTNACSRDEFLAAVISNPRFLYSAYDRLSSSDLMETFEKWGLRTKVERGRRAFPASDKSADVLDMLRARMKKARVEVITGARVVEIVTKQERTVDTIAADGEVASHSTANPSTADGRVASHSTAMPSASAFGEAWTPTENLSSGNAVSGVRYCKDGRTVFLGADAVLVATGGLSYPSTGSTGDGFAFAKSLGLSVKECRPSLVPFNCAGDMCRQMSGLSLKNVEFTVRKGKKVLFSDFGEMLFTHFGVSGPLVLTASAKIGGRIGKEELSFTVDLKPAVSQEELDRRLRGLLEESPVKALKNAIAPMYPASLLPVLLELAGADGGLRCADVTRLLREEILRLTKAFPLPVTGLRGYEEAVITQGGISVKEIDPKTMECRKIRGLYFAGEVLDLDALTGGYNLQIAWSTAAQAAAGILDS